MKTSAHYYRHHPYIDCGVLGSTRDHRSLQMTASVAAAMAAGAYYQPAGCLHGGPLTAGSLGYHGLSPPISSTPPDLLVKTDSSPMYGGPGLSPSVDCRRQVGLERGSTREFSSGVDLLFQSTNKTARPGCHVSAWTDVERVGNEAKVVRRQPSSDDGGDVCRSGSRKDDRGKDSSTAGKEAEEKQIMRFPWMKTTKSHAHQWKAQWSGKK